MNSTGSLLTSSKYMSMRFFSSSFVSTLMPLRNDLAILLNIVSTMFSHDACTGVNTNLNLPFLTLRYLCVSADLCIEWLSSIMTITYPSGNLESISFRNSMNSIDLCLSLTMCVTSPVSRSMPASSDNVPSLL